MLMKNKKASTPISIVILVIGTLILCIITLVALVTKEAAVREIISIPNAIYDAYAVESKVNFYLDNGGSKEKLIEMFPGLIVDGEYASIKEVSEGFVISYKFKLHA